MLAVGVVCAVGGCLIVQPRPVPPSVVFASPPPHAPAHGYRAKHPQENVDLVFDSGLGVYAVVGQPDCWWIDGVYYRWREGSFVTGVSVAGPWVAVTVDRVPTGLRSYKVKVKEVPPGKLKGKGKGKGH
jgi:hypothetical protein